MPFPLALTVAAIIAASASPCSAFVALRQDITAGSGVTTHLKNHRRPLENHIFIDEGGYRDERSSTDGKEQDMMSNSNSGSHFIHIDDGRPHGYRDPQAVMEMPNNVFIDGVDHGDAGGRPKKRKGEDELTPSQAREILGLPESCVDKTIIKKAYYDLVAHNHPDLNKWMDEAEEAEARDRLYRINGAFTCLRTALQNRPRIRPGYGAAGTSTSGSNWYDDHHGDHSSFFMP